MIRGDVIKTKKKMNGVRNKCEKLSKYDIL